MTDTVPFLDKAYLAERMKMMANERESAIERNTLQEIEKVKSSLTDFDINEVSVEDTLNNNMKALFLSSSAQIERMKQMNIPDENIRNAVLGEVQQMDCPFERGHRLEPQFNMLKQEMNERLDTQIIGEEMVKHRNGPRMG